MKIAKTLPLAGFFISVISTALLAQSQDQIIDDRSYGIVKILAGKEEETGTGIIVGYDSISLYVLTAKHVVTEESENKYSPNITLYFYKNPGLSLQAHVYRIDDNEDFALIIASTKGYYYNVRPIPLGDLSGKISAGSDVYTLGNPGTRSWAVDAGKLIKPPDAHKIGFSCESFDHGSSGGGLFDHEFGLIGMITSEASYGGIALRINLVLEQLDLWNVPINNVQIIDPVFRVDISPPEIEIEAGDTALLTPNIFNDRGSRLYDRAIEWVSSDNMVLRVSETGQVFALKPGEVTVTAFCENKSDISKIKVIKPIAAYIVFPQDTITLVNGQIITISPEVYDKKNNLIPPKNPNYSSSGLYDFKASDNIKWTSSNLLVATIDYEGKVTTVGSGTTRITAKYGKISNEMSVKVLKGTFSSVEIQDFVNYPNPQNNLLAGESIQLKLHLKNEYGKVINDTKTVAWSSSDNSIAAVASDGTVQAMKMGSVLITATCESFTDHILIKITGGNIQVSANFPDKLKCFCPDIRTSEWADLIMQVTDMRNKPLEAANVTIQSNTILFSLNNTGLITGKTGTDGTFLVKARCNNCNATEGNVEVTVSKDGYNAASYSKLIYFNQDMGPIRIEIVPNSYSIPRYGSLLLTVRLKNNNGNGLPGAIVNVIPEGFPIFNSNTNSNGEILYQFPHPNTTRNIKFIVRANSYNYTSGESSINIYFE